MTKTRKLAVISDFHMDSNGFTARDIEVFREVLLNVGVTDLHFNGDMSNDLKNLTLPFLKNLSALTEISVTYNLGNHDMVGLTENEISANDFAVKWFADVAFLSFNGWYDYSFMPADKLDVAKIEHFKNNFYFDRKIHWELDDIGTTARILAQLEQTLSALTKAKRIIISTHFVPEKSFIIDTRYEKFARFNAYLGSQHFHEIFMKFPNVSDVVFGHIHHRMNPVILGSATNVDARYVTKVTSRNRSADGIHYHAKALGYPYEWRMVEQFLQENPVFQIEQNWHLRKRYQAIKNLPEWQEYRQNHLAEEFLSALTVFEL